MNEAARSISVEHGSTFMLTIPAESKKATHHSSLVFLAVGQTYSLIEIRPTDRVGRGLVMKSKVKTTILAEGAK